jgi:hypothetical protein
MAYKYDVFISYKRGLIGDEWLDTRFVPLFQDSVENESSCSAKRKALGLFFDRSRHKCRLLATRHCSDPRHDAPRPPWSA